MAEEGMTASSTNPAAAIVANEEDEPEDYQTFKIIRMMNPDDANVYGNVHGGVILKQIEEVGAIMATRYCNLAHADKSQRSQCVGALVRIERTDFLKPMHIGEVAMVEARLVFTSTRSLQAVVRVHAENIMTGHRRLTNRARLWYVPLSAEDNTHVLRVPPMSYCRPEDEERGRREYEKQKTERHEAHRAKLTRQRTISLADVDEDSEVHTIPFSKSQLIHLVGASDLTVGEKCKGGVILKLMDSCAGMTAVRHCQSMAVTASFDAVNLRKQVSKGALITVTGQVTFASNRSIEIEVVVDAEVPWKPKGSKERVVDGYITFVSLSKEGKSQPIPPVKVRTSGEQERFEAGRKRYEYQKKLRLASRSLST